ncbi:MAG: Gfo/Idh/MocA family oxidoreductase [Chloroflexota bacterium]
MEEVKVCIVGMGIGRANGKGFISSPHTRIVALCDLLEDRMAEFAQEIPNPVKMYTDYEKMVKDPEIDAVFVGTPNQFHVPVALAAIANDKHVLVTKPLSDSVEAARRLVEAAEASGLVNMMSLSTRFAHEVQYLGQLAREGEFGQIYYARTRSIRRSGIPSWSLGFVKQGGGAFRDMGVHVLDSAWWLLGMPKPISVTGVGGAKFGPHGQGFWDFRPPPVEMVENFEADDYAGGLIRFENGAGLQVESFWASHQPNELQIELFGDKAGARLDPLTIYRTVNGAPQDSTVNIPERGRKTVWEEMATHFAACIRDGAECATPLRHGLIVQEMMEAMLESAGSGQEVRLG